MTLHHGRAFQERHLVLATGVVDELPSVDGLAERWGSSVFHCPYCHGYELKQGSIGVLATGPLSMHHALMLPGWGQVTLFSTERSARTRPGWPRWRGVTVERTPVARIVGRADVVLRDGRSKPMAGLFVMSRTHSGSPLAEQLGCALEKVPTGMYVRAHAQKASAAADVYCCGDSARIAGSVAFAVADGAMASVAAHQSLIFGAVDAASAVPPFIPRFRV